MYKSDAFISFVVDNENVTGHFLKLLIMKYGYNKMLMSMVKFMASQINEKKQKNLHMTITTYINKYGKFDFLFITFGYII